MQKHLIDEDRLIIRPARQPRLRVIPLACQRSFRRQKGGSEHTHTTSSAAAAKGNPCLAVHVPRPPYITPYIQRCNGIHLQAYRHPTGYMSDDIFNGIYIQKDVRKDGRISRRAQRNERCVPLHIIAYHTHQQYMPTRPFSTSLADSVFNQHLAAPSARLLPTYPARCGGVIVIGWLPHRQVPTDSIGRFAQRHARHPTISKRLFPFSLAAAVLPAVAALLLLRCKNGALSREQKEDGGRKSIINQRTWPGSLDMLLYALPRHVQAPRKMQWPEKR